MIRAGDDTAAKLGLCLREYLLAQPSALPRCDTKVNQLQLRAADGLAVPLRVDRCNLVSLCPHPAASVQRRLVRRRHQLRVAPACDCTIRLGLNDWRRLALYIRRIFASTTRLYCGYLLCAAQFEPAQRYTTATTRVLPTGGIRRIIARRRMSTAP